MRPTGRFEQAGDGYRVELEIPNAYTDGTSRFEWVFVPALAMAGDMDARAEALLNAATARPVDELRNIDLRQWAAWRAAGVAKPLEVLRGLTTNKTERTNP